MNDHLAAPVRELLALYAEKYANVEFPGIDLAVLEIAADDVAKAAAQVVEAEASIEPLREKAKAAEAELTQKVVRALAFLKVYVEGNSEDYARLEGLTQALLARRPSRKASDAKAADAPEGAGERKRRGRKPKNEAGAPEKSEVTLSPSELAEADLPSSALTALESVAE